MKFIIHAPWQVNEWFEDLVRKNMEKLATLYDRIERADIYLKADEGNPEKSKIVEIRLAVPQNDLFAEARADEIEKALDQATEKIRKQLRKRKQQLSDRH